MVVSQMRDYARARSDASVHKLEDSLLRTMFSIFAPLTLFVLTVYSVVQYQSGQYELTILYAATGVLIAINWWGLRFHNRTLLAANISLALGPIVLIPWQITGGPFGGALIWFGVYTVLVMALVGLRWGTVWTLLTYSISVAVLILQLQGFFPMPYPVGEMIDFYFAGLFIYINCLIFLWAQNKLSGRLKAILRDLEEEKENVKATLVKDEAIIASVGEGLISFNSIGEVERVNDKAEAMLGYSEKELMGKAYTDIVVAAAEDGRLLEPGERPVSQAINTKKSVSTTLTYTRKNGTAFPVQVTVAPVLLESGVLGVIEIFRDVTHEKEVDKVKTEFVSLASHQLRTPLSSISWYAEMLLNGDAGKISEEQTKYIQEIYDGNHRMIDLVNALLNVSRIDLGTFAVDPEPTDMAKLCEDIVKGLEPRIFARKIDFKEDYQDKLPKIEVDPKLMRMVIENLASNAVKYTPEKGSITLSLKKEGNDLLITVKDSGWGIPKHQQYKVFGKLFRADNVKTKDTEGTGLGLYIVKSIVDYTGGKIWFESEEDEGTTFFVQLPIEGMKQKEGSKRLG